MEGATSWRLMLLHFGSAPRTRPHTHLPSKHALSLHPRLVDKVFDDPIEKDALEVAGLPCTLPARRVAGNHPRLSRAQLPAGVAGGGGGRRHRNRAAGNNSAVWKALVTRSWYPPKAVWTTWRQLILTPTANAIRRTSLTPPEVLRRPRADVWEEHKLDAPHRLLLNLNIQENKLQQAVPGS